MIGSDPLKTYNHTTYAILGILTTGCNTGYAIKQFIDQSLNHFWKISYGQIYPTLKRLVDEGLATVRTVSEEGKPNRHAYTLTSRGIDVLKHWLEAPIEQIPIERNEVLLKLFFGQHQAEDHTIQLLGDYQQKLIERQRVYQDIETSIKDNQVNDKNAIYWLFTLDYGKRVTQAAIEWCDVTRTRL